jgi:hypothetical protein
LLLLLGLISCVHFPVSLLLLLLLLAAAAAAGPAGRSELWCA